MIVTGYYSERKTQFAAADLNALRTARINGYTIVILATKEAAITAVMDERFKELAYKGHRFWDLKRRDLPIVCLVADLPQVNAATSLPIGISVSFCPFPMLKSRQTFLFNKT